MRRDKRRLARGPDCKASTSMSDDVTVTDPGTCAPLNERSAQRATGGTCGMSPLKDDLQGNGNAKSLKKELPAGANGAGRSAATDKDIKKVASIDLEMMLSGARLLLVRNACECDFSIACTHALRCYVFDFLLLSYACFVRGCYVKSCLQCTLCC